MSFTFAGRWDDEFSTRSGRSLGGASVTVYESDGTTLATLYTGRTKAATSANPFTCDAQGNGGFFADPGDYRLNVVYHGRTVLTVTDLPASRATVHEDGAESEADAAAHEADTTGVHGVADTAQVLRFASNRPYIDLTYAPYNADPTGVVDSSAAMQAAITALGTTGGDIFLPPGTLLWNSVVPAFLRSMVGWIRVRGAGAGLTTIKLTSTSPRAFDLNKLANYDNFGKIDLADFTVDCNNVGGQHHVILGDYPNGVPQGRYNLNGLRVRRINTTNVPVDSTMANHRTNLYFSPFVGTIETQATCTDIVVEDLDLQGGNVGVAFAAGRLASGVTDSANVYYDNIHIRRVKHSLLAPQTTLFYSSHVHLVGRGLGGYDITVDDCVGDYSGDVGIEIDAASLAVVRNCKMRNSLKYGFYHTNFNAPEFPQGQTIRWEDCTFVRTQLADGTNVVGRGWGAIKDSSYTAALPGTVEIINGAFYKTAADFRTDGIAGIFQACPRVVVDGFRHIETGINHTDVGSATPAAFSAPIGSGFTTELIVKNLYFKIQGTKDPSSGSLVWHAVKSISGLLWIEVDGLDVSFDLTNAAGTAARYIQIGTPATVQGGFIRRVRILRAVGDTTPRPVNFGASTSFSGNVFIEDCDFRQSFAGVEVAFATAANAASVYQHNNRYATFPIVASAISPTGSPFTYQNLDGYEERVVVQGGTVSLIEISIDGTTFVNVGATSGVFVLAHVDRIRVTYSSAPTITKMPLR